MAVIETPAVEAPPTPQAPEVPARKQAVSDYTRDLLLKVRDKILEEPHLFYMPSWTNRLGCGTASCIAGWAARLTGEDPGSWHVAEDGYREGARILGITRGQANDLFYRGNWPEPFYSVFPRMCETPGGGTYIIQDGHISVRAEVAAARIMHFIETGE